MPGAAFAGVVLLNMAALVITGLKVVGKLEAGRKRGKIWSAWHQTLGLIGVALLPQVRSVTSFKIIPCDESSSLLTRKTLAEDWQSTASLHVFQRIAGAS